MLPDITRLDEHLAPSYRRFLAVWPTNLNGLALQSQFCAMQEAVEATGRSLMQRREPSLDMQEHDVENPPLPTSQAAGNGEDSADLPSPKFSPFADQVGKKDMLFSALLICDRVWLTQQATDGHQLML